MDWLGQAGLGIITAAAASWITVQFSLRKFYYEKWWERRFESYTLVLDALHRLNRALLEQRTRIQDSNIAKHYPDFTPQRLIEPVAELHRAIDFGGILISREMAALLKSFAEALGDTTKLGDEKAFFHSIEIIGKTLPRAVDLARKDLGIGPWGFAA